MRRAVLLLFTTCCLAQAQAPLQPSPVSAYERKASETDKPAVFGYMISDFFHQRYQQGSAPLWRATGWLLALNALLLADLIRRRGWRR